MASQRGPLAKGGWSERETQAARALRKEESPPPPPWRDWEGVVWGGVVGKTLGGGAEGALPSWFKRGRYRCSEALRVENMLHSR